MSALLGEIPIAVVESATLTQRGLKVVVITMPGKRVVTRENAGAITALGQMPTQDITPKQHETNDGGGRRMYKTDYFYRGVSGRAMAEADLKRGFSYYGYDKDDPLDGLSGYGPYETAEEAEEAARQPQLQGYDHMAIFTGRYVGPDPDSGDLFEPRELIKVFSLQEKRKGLLRH